MLRKIRIAAAAAFIAGITALFLTPSCRMGGGLGWMPKIQLLPAVLAANFLVVAIILIITLLVGRVYCSAVCPLGVLQDIFFRLGRCGKSGKAGKSKYRKPHNWTRYIILALFIVAMAAGFNSIAVLLAPYSTYGRIVASIANFETVNTATLITACITLAVVTTMSLVRGRLWCNSICPVGSVLSLLSRHAFIRPRFDKDKCIGCGKCERGCRSMCIDVEHRSVDASRCVMCLDCTCNCPTGAMRLSRHNGSVGNSESAADDGGGRRRFVAAAAAVTVASTIEAQQRKVDGGLAAIEKKAVPKRDTPLKPFGSGSLRRFSSHCTACQLCVSRCPNGVLRPSASFDTLMQPEMGYEKGYCRMECVACSEVCPTGAIQHISREEKTSISIGRAKIIKENCLAYKGEASCGNCARHCPAAAIDMSSGHPVVDEAHCLGCGACEYLCPVRPFCAIYVEGREEHTAI